MEKKVAPPITGREASTTRAKVHRTAREMIGPHRNMANKLNMLPTFSPVAF